jgi:hypothetical protein
MNPFFKVAARVSPIFRRKRIEKFVRLFELDANTRILDVGGLPRFWTVPIPAELTILNLEPLADDEAVYLQSNMRAVVGNGTRLDFADQEFDIVFSNSVIEHVGTFENQIAFAREIRRVGRSYWVQTPAHECPIEPHYFAPFIHWMPKTVQRRLLRNFTPWGLMGRPSPAFIEEALAELRLMTKHEVQTLFPDAEIWTERMLTLPKSYTAFKLRNRAPADPTACSVVIRETNRKVTHAA